MNIRDHTLTLDTEARQLAVLKDAEDTLETFSDIRIYGGRQIFTHWTSVAGDQQIDFGVIQIPPSNPLHDEILLNLD